MPLRIPNAVHALDSRFGGALSGSSIHPALPRPGAYSAKSTTGAYLARLT